MATTQAASAAGSAAVSSAADQRPAGLIGKLRDPDFQRVLFKRINVAMLLMWRLGLGRMMNAAPAITGRVMVIVTTGRRSGRMRRFPITYAPADGHVYCLAGFGTSTDWYRNALEHPEARAVATGRLLDRSRRAAQS